ncbi:MAG: prolyl aminopeptidase [Methylococcaceae bacterium]
MKPQYPPIEPFHSFFLQTEDKHSVYVEQSGNPQGIPVIFLHGGPCSGTRPGHRSFFNPDKYHIILMDQRGCGQSLPFGELENNTTQDLMDDMENIRKQLGIDKWLLFGGSWGSAITLLYAQMYTENILGMVIRGVFLARQKDLDWFAKDGAGRIYPEQWEQLNASIPERSGTELVQGLYDAVFGSDQVTQRRAAKAWINWGGQVALMQDYQEDDKPVRVTEKMVQQVKMELHFAHNKYFIAENQVLDNCEFLQHIPTIIIHGRYDFVCPIEAGVSLSKALPNAEFIVLPNGGHIASGDDMIDALVDSTDRMLELI